MPIYEYECVSCNHRFELKQGFDAEPTESCPSCQGFSRRLFHAPVVIYKGSGFYTTDYARKDQRSNHESSDSDGATSDSDGATSDSDGATSDSAGATPKDAEPTPKKEKETSTKED